MLGFGPRLYELLQEAKTLDGAAVKSGREPHLTYALRGLVDGPESPAPLLANVAVEADKLLYFVRQASTPAAVTVTEATFGPSGKIDRPEKAETDFEVLPR